MNRTLSFTVSSAQNGTDIKTFIRRGLGLSARVLTALKYEGEILLNGVHARSIDRLKEGDQLTLTLFDEKGNYVPVESELTVLYEDEDFLVLHKPADMPVHPSPGHDADSVLNAAAWYFSNTQNFVFRPMYRLDRDTTGALVLAKNKFAACAELEKTYIAVCEGETLAAGTVNAPIGLTPGHKVQRCTGIGQFAETRYRTLRTGNEYSLIEFQLLTGRTHQIRVHMASIGHPVAGDDLYGGHLDRTNRQMLCCNSVRIRCPVLNTECVIRTDFTGEQKKLFPELFK